MTIVILKRDPNQTIPRPFARAVSEDEMVEIIESWAKHHPTTAGVKLDWRPERIGEESYVYRHGATHFYAFRASNF